MHIYIYGYIYIYVYCFEESTMGWLRLLIPLKLQVSFAKEPYKRDYILQKRPIILRSLLIVGTPYPQYPQVVSRLLEIIGLSCKISSLL